jgi:glycosyltransferase involved in cell wall biosynthesis
MRVLALTPDAPSRTHLNGGTTRQYQLLHRLIELGHEVTVVGPFPVVEHDQIGELEAAGFTVHGIERPASRLSEVALAVLRRPSILFSLFHKPTSAIVSAIYRSKLEPIVRELLTAQQFDVVTVEREMAADWIEMVSDLPAVLSFQHLESAYHLERAERMGGSRRRGAKRQAKLCRSYERSWAPRYDGVVCMSESELEQLREVVPNLPPTVAIGNGASLSAFDGLGPDPATHHILFTGTMNFEPNVVAADWLVKQVWPAIHSRVPEAQLDIVGRDPLPETLALGEQDGVTVHGGVPSMQPYYEAASICLLPMLEGGGTRLKLADAFAAKRAVVATTNGATGVDVTDGDELLVRDGADDFAYAVCELLKCDELRNAIAERGRRFAEVELNWSVLGERYARALENAISQHRAN